MWRSSLQGLQEMWGPTGKGEEEDGSKVQRPMAPFKLLVCLWPMKPLLSRPSTIFFIFLFIYWLVFLEQKEGRRERNIDVRAKYPLAASCTTPGRDPACNRARALPGKSQQQPFGAWETPTNWATWSGLSFFGNLTSSWPWAQYPSLSTTPKPKQFWNLKFC